MIVLFNSFFASSDSGYIVAIIEIGAERIFVGSSHKLILIALAAGLILFVCMCFYDDR